MTQGTTRDDADQGRLPDDAGKPETIDLRALERPPPGHASRPPAPPPSRNVSARLAAARSARRAATPPAPRQAPEHDATPVHDAAPVHDTSRVHDTTRVHDTGKVHDTSRAHRLDGPAAAVTSSVPRQLRGGGRSMADSHGAQSVAEDGRSAATGPQPVEHQAAAADPRSTPHGPEKSPRPERAAAEVLRSVLGLAVVALVFGVLGFLLGDVLQLSGR